MIQFDSDALAAITPGAQLLYRETFDHWSELRLFGVLATKLRADHFLAQCLHETGGLRVLIENLNYSAQRMTEVWPGRFPNAESAALYAGNPRALANKVYGGRMGNVEPNDGWRYIGRGLLQLTGRSAYQKIGHRLVLNLVDFPAEALNAEHGMQVAGAIWEEAGCNAFADQDALQKVTRAINGGLIGLPERSAWLQKVRANHVIQEGPSDVH